MAPVRCEACRFDQRDHTWADLMGSLRAVAPRFAWSIEGIDPDVLNTRPAPATWSPLEYGRHLRDVLWAWRGVAQLTLEDGGEVPDIAPRDAAPGDTVRPLDPARAVDLLTTEAAGYHELVARLDPESRRRAITVLGDDVDIEWQVAHVVHECHHHLADVGRGIVALGAGTPTQEGTVAQISRSDGGVPKTAVPEAQIGHRGVIGDRQANRKHHGRPWQALCLWSTEVIEDLNAEGNQLAPGSAGENLTLAGIDWATLRPGTRLRIGEEVLVELSAWAAPCAKNRRWFADGDETHMAHERHPGRSRAYASVLCDGVVRTGDRVVAEPGD